MNYEFLILRFFAFLHLRGEKFILKNISRRFSQTIIADSRRKKTRQLASSPTHQLFSYFQPGMKFPQIPAYLCSTIKY